MVLYEGDWMIGDGSWDTFADELPDFVDVITPWSLLADAPAMPVTFVTTSGGIASLRRCGVTDPDHPSWQRDADGVFHEGLDAGGMLEDDCVDVGEPTVVLAQAMRELGFDVAELFMPNSGHMDLSAEESDIFADEVMSIIDR
jgi:hypothetical protein